MLSTYGQTAMAISQKLCCIMSPLPRWLPVSCGPHSQHNSIGRLALCPAFYARRECNLVRACVPSCFSKRLGRSPISHQHSHAPTRLPRTPQRTHPPAARPAPAAPARRWRPARTEATRQQLVDEPASRQRQQPAMLMMNAASGRCATPVTAWSSPWPRPVPPWSVQSPAAQFSNPMRRSPHRVEGMGAGWWAAASRAGAAAILLV